MDHETSPSPKTKTEYTVSVPDRDHQILLAQLAFSQGLRAYVPGRSAKRVVVQGTEVQVSELVEKAQQLGLQLELKRLKALEEFLQENSLEVPLRLATALSIAEAKVGLARSGLCSTKSH